MDILVSAFCMYLLWCIYQLYLSFFANKGRNDDLPALPPGPPAFPLVGNLFSLGRLPHRSLHELSRTYGPILKLSLGRITTVVVSSPSLARDILQKHDSCFANRFVPDAITANDHHQHGLGFMPISPLFKTLRKTYNTHIFSVMKLDGNRHLRMEQVRRLIQDVTACARDGRAVNIGEASFRTTLDLLSNTAFSVDLADSGSNLMTGELKKLVTDVMTEVGRPNFADYFPVLKRWDPQGTRRRTEAYFGRIFDILEDILEKRTEARAGRGWRRKDDLLETLLDLCQDEDKDKIDLVLIKHLLLVN